MRCPYCGCLEDKVIESRNLSRGACIRRRRECLSCKHRFTSYEHIDEKPLMVIKRDKRRELFDRIKIERGIQRAVEKRSLSSEIIEEIVTKIEEAALLMCKNSKEIESAVLAEMVLSQLYAIDEAGYLRFASVYKQFTHFDEFISEIQRAGSLYGKKSGK